MGVIACQGHSDLAPAAGWDARNLATEGAQIRGAVVSALSAYYFKKSPWVGDANGF